jgi:hypothetical protein
MADLGVRANVMGPQPIAQVRKAPEAMVQAAERLIAALMRGARDEVAELTHEQARDQMSKLADAIPRGAYDNFKIIGGARVANHFFTKARLTGPSAQPFTFQFRMGEGDDGKWTVREAANLTGVRSGWTK